MVEHQTTAMHCNNLTVTNLDLGMAVASTILAYLILFPVLFLFSQILVPSFNVEFKGKDKFLERIEYFERENKIEASKNRVRTEKEKKRKKKGVLSPLTNNSVVENWNKPELRTLTFTRFLARTFKFFGMFVASDWMYLLLTYSFGHILLDMIRTFIGSVESIAKEKSITDDEKRSYKPLLDVIERDKKVETTPPRPRTYAIQFFFDGREMASDHERY